MHSTYVAAVMHLVCKPSVLRLAIIFHSAFGTIRLEYPFVTVQEVDLALKTRREQLEKF
jgi:hypothetical protein